MKKILSILIAMIIFSGCSQQKNINKQPNYQESKKEKISMKLQSPAFENNKSIPPKYTCDGDDISPPLLISEVPKEAKSLVLIVDDPDAPGGDWVHWVIWNIPPATQKIEEDSTPQGSSEGLTDFRHPGWGGPCPPSGEHRYRFKLYALDSELKQDYSYGKKQIQKNMEGHILDYAELVGLYQRQ